MDVYFATANPNKVKEVQSVLPAGINLKSIRELGVDEDIPETGETIADNSLQKARYVYDRYGVACIADDTGLEIEALNNEPGVYSARYAGPEKNPEANMSLVLEKLKDKENRSARFVTVISLIDEKGQVSQFEGIVQGKILQKKKGTGGFGYDPIFLPDGYDQTFAEMSLSEKNHISHRGQAIRQFTAYIQRFFHES